MSGSEPEVPSVRIPAALPDGVSQATIGVRGGLLRSGFEETSEAMYLTSGYVYSSAAQAEKAFTGEIDRYVYSRYGNPTISMFEERLRLIEDAPAAFATATGMAAVFTALGALLGAGDRLVHDAFDGEQSGADVVGQPLGRGVDQSVDGALAEPIAAVTFSLAVRNNSAA